MECEAKNSIRRMAGMDWGNVESEPYEERRNFYFKHRRSMNVDSSPWASPSCKRFVYYFTAVEMTHTSTLYIKQVIIPPLSVFVGRRYLQHEGLESNGTHRLMNQLYFILNDLHMKDTTAFVCGESLTAWVATEADWAASKLVETYRPTRKDVERERMAFFQAIALSSSLLRAQRV